MRPKLPASARLAHAEPVASEVQRFANVQGFANVWCVGSVMVCPERFYALSAAEVNESA